MKKEDEKMAQQYLRDAIENSFTDFPSELKDRKYNYPRNYPDFKHVRELIASPLALFSSRMVSELGSDELEGLAAGYMTRFKAWQYDHPIYLLSNPLVTMLAHTSRLEEPNIDTDSRPPHPAGYFVLPRHLIGLPNGDYARMISYALLDVADFKQSRHIKVDKNLTGRRFCVQTDMASGYGFYSKLEVGEDGVVQNPEDADYLEPEGMQDEYGSRAVPGETNLPLPKIIAKDGAHVVATMSNLVLALSTYLNMEKDIEYEAFEKRVGNRKKGLPPREFWKPAMIGKGLLPTGNPTHGGHASPHSHIRRGHWRRTWFGEGRTESRRMWIKPTVVNAATEGGMR